MKTLGKRLEFLIELRGTDQTELAKKVGCTQSNISKIVRNETVGGKIAGGKFLPEIAKALHANLDWLKTGIGRDPLLYGVIDDDSVPYIEWDEVQKNIKLINLLKDKNRKVVVNPKYKVSGPNCYALKVIGESMVSTVNTKASCCVGSTIIVDPDRPASNYDYVIAIKSGNLYPIFAQYTCYGSECYLKPLNPQYPTLSMDFETIVGVVVAHMNLF